MIFILTTIIRIIIIIPIIINLHIIINEISHIIICFISIRDYSHMVDDWFPIWGTSRHQ